MVRRPGRWAEPHVPVQPGRDRFARQVTGLGRAAAVDVDLFDLARLAAPALANSLHVVTHDALTAAGDDSTITARCLDHGAPFANSERFRLLAIHILALLTGRDDDDGVPVIRCGNVDCIEIFAS